MKIKKYHPQHSALTGEEIILAGFWRRTASMLIDIIIIGLLFRIATQVLSSLRLQIDNVNFHNFHVEVKGYSINEKNAAFIEFGFTLIPTLYFVLFNYFSNGKTIGKLITRIRVVSIYHHRISFWHCVERALGYAASSLEAGLGFLQIFWNPNRMCLHDRIAETIVIQEKKRENKK